MKHDYRNDFPLLLQKSENGLPLAYLDNAATTQKPQQVIDAVSNYYRTYNANTHRGSYSISIRATDRFEQVRAKTATFIRAADSDEIIFTSGTTDALNQVALAYGWNHIKEGDEILISVTEHHSNLLPWQRLARLKGAALCYLYPDQDGRISIDEVAKKLSDRTRIVAVTHISNVLGSVNPIKEISALAHKNGAVIVVDAAQSAPHIPINVQDLDIDFLAFSGHKMLAPAGIGVLYGKKNLLKELEPVRLGGGMVEEVTEQSVRFLDAPLRFEAGTQNVEGVIGLGAAIDYLNQISFPVIEQIESQLTGYALEKLSHMPEIELYGAPEGAFRTGILSFNVKDVHPHDTATILASHGIAVRAGHHCAQPLMNYLGVSSACRMSLYFYNTMEDIDRLFQALSSVREVLGYGTE